MCRSVFHIDGPEGQEHVAPGDKASIVDGCLIITRNRADGPSQVMLALAAGA